VLANNRPLHVAFCGPQTKADRIAQYIAEGMRWGGGMKPRASFVAPSHRPEPWTGKYEKETAHVPWDGRK
ncbi:hypothetical protein, partial [Streptococcus pneumoniae]|uniref:hypothetical protein n=1 Tax=Streptococcus pneumoniae TaxID=1313 RepID=UPI001E4FC018